MTMIYYSVGDDNYRLETKTNYDIHKRPKRVAEDAAEDYHDNHDGWESSSWPVEITLYETQDGPALGVFEVDREAQPVFMATLKTRST